MAEKTLLLIGNGGHAASIVELVRHLPQWRIVGAIIAPGSSCRRHKPTKVVGFEHELDIWTERVDGVIIAVGQIEKPALRVRLFERLRRMNAPLVTLVAANATVAANAVLGRGTVVMQQALVNAFARIGDNVIINTQALIEHDACIGDHTHVSTGARIHGGVSIGRRCFIGSGAIIGQGVRIGDDVVIGAGSVVIRDIAQPGVYAGNPARRIRNRITM